MSRHAYRARLLGFHEDPLGRRWQDVGLDIEDGVLLVDQGRIAGLGPAEQWLPRLGPDIPVTDWRGCLLMPGFVDTHMHFAQAEIIGAHGPQLLEWLEHYTYPAEQRCADPEQARILAEFSIGEMLRNGTTTAMVFATVHSAAADAIFSAARARQMRLIAGKVMMDRHAPPSLCDTAAGSYRDSAALIERWHGCDRLAYAVTPRFAPTSSPEQLQQARRLLQDYPGVYLQTHLAENRNEVDWVAQLFPEARSYLDVYERYGLLGERSVFAHCLHLDSLDRQRMAATGSVASFCPSSNLFLGSGLFDLAAADAAGQRVALGTDVGAGTSFGLLPTLHDACKVCNLAGYVLDPLRALYLATLGGARALGLDHCIGRLQAGYEADFIIVDPQATPLLARRSAQCTSLRELLFALMILGDDRCIRATHVLGQAVHRA